MPSNVYYSSLKNKQSNSPLNKIKKLLNRCDVKDNYLKNDLTAIKVHFGELGNTAFLRPIFLRPIIETLKLQGVKPFLTDTNTLYVGMRTNSVDHIHNAVLNGFNYSTLQTPIIIADGLRGESMVDIPVNGELIQSAKLAREIINADSLLLVSHFKGHELTGFGGAIKNLSMGCAARAGKLDMHSESKPMVVEEHCTACGRCKAVCQVKAITISHFAKISDACTGCSRCIGVCPSSALRIKYDSGSESVQKKMAEYALAVIKNFPRPVICVNVLTSIVPKCDCSPANDEPVVRDLGFIASTDPVAADRASYDLVLAECGGKNPFMQDGTTQLEHGAKIGLGSCDYKLIDVDK